MKQKEDIEQKEIENFINEMKTKMVVEEEDGVEIAIKNMKFEKTIKDKALEYFEKVIPNE